MANINGKGGQGAGEPSRNPNGRPPKDKSLTNLIRRGLATRVDVENGKTAALGKVTVDKFCSALHTGYLDGDKVSVKERISLFQTLLNRIDGMPRQAMEITQTTQAPIVTVDEMATAMKELEEWRKNQNGDE